MQRQVDQWEIVVWWEWLGFYFKEICWVRFGVQERFVEEMVLFFELKYEGLYEFVRLSRRLQLEKGICEKGERWEQAQYDFLLGMVEVERVCMSCYWGVFGEEVVEVGLGRVFILEEFLVNVLILLWGYQRF